MLRYATEIVTKVWLWRKILRYVTFILICDADKISYVYGTSSTLGTLMRVKLITKITYMITELTYTTLIPIILILE